MSLGYEMRETALGHSNYVLASNELSRLATQQPSMRVLARPVGLSPGHAAGPPGPGLREGSL